MPADLVTRLLLKNDDFDRRLQQSKQQVQNFEKGIGVLRSGMTKFVAGFSSMAGVSLAFMDITQKSMQFEKALSSLRSLTGVSANEMDTFKRQAIKMGSTSTQTASQVVDAFKLIGSQKPELLKNKEALAEVTNQAIILAEAAGMEVPQAAKALTGSLNQMGESADKAGEYINILAAASQAGSADIPYLTKAIEKSGGAASSVGVKYNELVAAIEAIAPKISEASEAGTNLRNIFLTLESNADKNLKPSVVGLTKALENLAAKNLDATQMTKMFGKESVTAALAIVSAKDNYLELVNAITGTNKAIDQQRINNHNLAGSINGVSSAWEGLVLTLNKSNGPLKEAADLLTALLHTATEALKTEEQKQSEIIEEGVRDRKKSLDKEIEGWMILGNKKKAVEETMRQFNLRNPEGGDLSNELDLARSKLSSMQLALAKMEDSQQTKTAFDVLGKHLTGLPNISTSYADISGKKALEENIRLQQESVNNLEIKNELYKASVQYLQNELDATNKIKKEGDVSKIDIQKASVKAEAKPAPGSLAYLDSQIADLTKKLSKETDESVRGGLRNAIEKFKEEKHKIELGNLEKGSLDYINAQIAYTTQKLNKETDKAVRFGLYAALEKFNKEKHWIELEATLGRNLLKGDTFGKPTGKKPSDTIDAIKSGKEKISIHPAKIDKAVIASNYDYADSLQAIGSVLSSVTNLTNEGAAAWLSYGANIVTASASAVSAILSMIPVKKADATANTEQAATGLWASMASVPVVGWVMAGAAVATMIASIASIPKFASGGVVPGNMYFGDRVPIMANSGELILNQSQQGKLFRMINSGVVGNNIEVGGKITVEGSKLAVLIKKVNDKKDRVR